MSLLIDLLVDTIKHNSRTTSSVKFGLIKSICCRKSKIDEKGSYSHLDGIIFIFQRKNDVRGRRKLQ